MLLDCLGGIALSQQHAVNSATLMNTAQPDYLSTLVVILLLGTERMGAVFGGQFQLPDQMGLFQEMHTLLDHFELEQMIFRSDHASNYLVLKRVLGKDKAKLLA